MKIVTFCCQPSVHVYPDGCSVAPASPCKFHSSIKKAKSVLRKRGIKNPKVIVNE